MGNWVGPKGEAGKGSEGLKPEKLKDRPEVWVSEKAREGPLPWRRGQLEKCVRILIP